MTKTITSTGVCAEGIEADQEACVAFATNRIEPVSSIPVLTPCYDAVLSTVEFVTSTELAMTHDHAAGETEITEEMTDNGTETTVVGTTR
ncbi:hypothetical protein [Natrinema sp. SYSU A 869]|uniref:hypothetical protein n=1 Tax=Natrinema sp. SYSU A 869 TaxID=2871694 RepID=UPI001CA3CBF4|nr:hypothetical protein [Natrinema sp. SYSU A 869]